MQSFVMPMLPRLSKAPPSSVDWQHEFNFDGFRIQPHVVGGAVKIYSRNGADFTRRFRDSCHS